MEWNEMEAVDFEAASASLTIKVLQNLALLSIVNAGAHCTPD